MIKRLINLNFADITEEFTLKNEEVKKASYIDKLTKLYNRNYFDVLSEHLKEEDFPLGIIMLDANGLKLTNDTYGHDVGDALLQSVANILKAICTDGLNLRWGGDEFLMIVKHTSRKELEEKIQAFQRLAKQTKIKSFTLSASLGYAIARKSSQDETLFETINQAETMMYNNKVFESLSNKRKIIDQILSALYDSLSFEEKHSKNVMRYALMIGEELKLSSNDLSRLRLASLMHDVGKIGVPDTLLSKTEPLSKEERDEIRKHAEKGFRILSAYPELSEYGNYALTHHEWYNGGGYPQGLKGKNIPYLSRIISVADAYDAMTSERVYKASKTKEQAIKELIRCKGTQFDPVIVDAFVQTINH